MSTETLDDNELIAELSKMVVIEIVPEELMFFDEILHDYFSNPKTLKQKISKNPLGFGVDDAFVALTPAIIASISAIVEFINLRVELKAQEQSTKALKESIKVDMIKRDKKNDGYRFTIAQLESIKQVVEQEAIGFGLKSKRAKEFSKAIVGILALESKVPSQK